MARDWTSIPEPSASSRSSALAEGEPLRPAITVFLSAAGALLLEASLSRVLSYTGSHHLVYPVIGMALLGFGASGAVVASFPGLFAESRETRLRFVLLAAAAATVLAVFILAPNPLDVEAFAAAPGVFSLQLLTYAVIVALPFFGAGFGVVVPLAADPASAGRLYGWQLLGAALACVATVWCIEPFGAPGLTVAAAALFVAAAGVVGAGYGGTALVVAAVVGFAFARPLGDRIPIAVAPSKRVHQLHALSAGQETFVRWTALGRVEVGGWGRPTTSSFWARNGVASGDESPGPRGGWVTYDGAGASSLLAFSGNFDEYAMLEGHLLSAPYQVKEDPNVLVIGAGGGIHMLTAMRNGARRVTGVELQPDFAALVLEPLENFTSNFYHRPDVRLVTAEGRDYVRRSDEQFDLVQVTVADEFAAQWMGAYLFADSYRYTVEAVVDYLARLPDDGILTMVVAEAPSGDALPLTTRLGLAAYRALEAIGAPQPADHLLVVGAPGEAGPLAVQSVLVKKSPLWAAEVATLRKFAGRSGFEVLHAPGDEHLRLTDLLGADESTRQRVLAGAAFRMAAVTDDDPFFHQIAPWSSPGVGENLDLAAPGSALGRFVRALLIIQALLLGCAVAFLPLLKARGDGLHVQSIGGYVTYFALIGIGFMWVQITTVQAFTLFLGSPSLALPVTLFSLLLFASVGSRFSVRWREQPTAVLGPLVGVLAVLIVAYVAILPSVLAALLPLDLVWRILVTVLVQMPMGFVLGTFLPLGIACAIERDGRIAAWAWAVHGVGAVTGTALAVALAMQWGFTVVALGAAVLYGGGTLLLLRVQQTGRPPARPRRSVGAARRRAPA